MAVTEETLREHKAAALRLYQRSLDRMHGHLSASARYGISDALQASLQRDAQLFPDEALRVNSRYPMQPYRHKGAYIYRKLAATLDANRRPWRADHLPRPNTYDGVEDFIADLRLMQDSLRERHGERLAGGRLGVLIRQARIFGFHLATLDLRQHADKLRAALTEVFRRYGLAADYASLPEADKESCSPVSCSPAVRSPRRSSTSAPRPTRRSNCSASSARRTSASAPMPSRTSSSA